MIISHKHKFIFVHLGRTGGRSLTMELAKHCGPDDVITPTGDYAGQNVGTWRRHSKASQIRDRLGQNIWDEYFTFTFERNPWDKVLSNYWSRRGYEHGKGGATESITWIDRVWRKTSGYPWSFETWVKFRWYFSSGMGVRNIRFPTDIGKYTDNDDQPIVNFIGRYEHYPSHLRYLSERLGIEIKLQSKEGRSTRKDRRKPEEIYSTWSAELIANVFAKELELLDYQFGTPALSSILIDGKPQPLSDACKAAS